MEGAGGWLVNKPLDELITELKAEGRLGAMPRPVPDDFAPELTDMGYCVVVKHYDGQFVNMGFSKTGDLANDRRLAESLRQSVWYMLEEVRLGGKHLAEPEGRA
jgi:hypothetical protein